MKKYITIFLIMLCIKNTYGQQFPTFDWARVASEGYPAIPSVGTNYSSSVTIIKRDAVGNIYLVGGLNKAMKFANQDIYSQDYFGSIYGNYLMKLNPTGETILWVKTMVYGDISEIDLGNDGYIYIVGQGSGGGTLKYGDATQTGGISYPNVAGDALLYKINSSNGNMVWIKKANSANLGGANYKFIQTDNTAIYATDVLGPNANNSTTNRGYRIFKATKAGIDADPSLYINNKVWTLDKTWFRANVDPLFENHIFDMKLTNDKQSLWVYLKTGDVWIDDFSNQQFDTTEMIVIRLDNLNASTPTVGFMKRYPSLHCPDAGQLEIDSQGNILLTGYFGVSHIYNTPIVNGNGTVTFGGITYEFPVNSSKQFIAKLSPTGAETWIKFYDIQVPYQFRSLTTDISNNIYVAGGSIPSFPTIASFTSVNDPWWVMKLKPDGEQVYMWSNEEGGSNNSDPVLCATGTSDVTIGVNGGGGKYGTKEIVRYSSFVLTNLKHSGTTKPFEEFKRLKNINTGADVLSQYSSHPTKYTELGGNLVFFAWGGAALGNECHLWKTDGTENGTTSLAAMYYTGDPSPSQPYSGETAKSPTHIYFEGQSRNPTNNNYQKDIWKSDGTVAGTIKIKTFDLGTTTFPSGNANGLTPYDIRDIEYSNGIVFFTMTDATNSKIDLWKTDGTEPGTIRIYEGCQSQISSFNNYIYYFIKGIPDPNFGNVQFTLRRHNGTSGGFVKNLAQTNAANIPRFFGVVNNQLLFTADGTIVLNSNNVNSGMELWKTDGTGAGTVIVKDINPEVSNNFPPGPFSAGKNSISYANKDNSVNGVIKEPALEIRSIIHNNTLYFGADDGANGSEIWKSDGTEAGTVLIKDLVPGTYTDIYGQTYPNGSDPYSFYVFQNNLVFTGWATGTENIALYKTDGTNLGTSIIKNHVRHGISYNYNVPMSYAVLNNNLYFSGKEQPNSLIHPTYNEPFTGNFNELWVSDGSAEGTKQLKNLVKGWQVFNPMNLYAWNGSLYFTMYGGISPNIQVTHTEAEPWKFTPAACISPAPAGPLATVPTILASYPATIKSNGCLGIVKWYAAASGGLPIFTGDNYTTPLLNTTTTYYLSCTFNNCESQRSPATVTVNQPNCTTLPAVPSSAGGSVVNGNSITLSAIGCTEQTRWYGQASGGAILAQTPTYTTPVLTTPTTYYPVCFVLGCESQRTVLDNITITPSSGQALDFDGTDDVVTVPANAGFNAQNFTMEAWVRFDVNNRNQTIMHNDYRYFYYNYTQNGSSIKFGFADNGSPREAGFSFTPTTGNWYHLACTFNNTTKECSFYINGELQDIQNINFAPSQTNTGMKLGTAFSVSGSELDGRLEDARFWSIVRTETQIGASYNTELSGNESGLVFYYKFDGEATCDVQDCSPNQLHGTRSGATGTNNKPLFFNTSVALTDVNCGVSSACTLLNPCLSALGISSPNYTTETVIRQASAINGLLTATNQITNTAKIAYQSKAILLSTGFIAQPTSGGYFKAEIGGCN
jgi:ELWxxDGT repeat protein